MEAGELALFERGIRHATETASGEVLDDALVGLGWPDALAADRRAGVSILFESLGRANATSSALDHVLATALGAGGAGHDEPAVILPPVPGHRPPGRLTGGRCTVRGLAFPTLARRDRALVVVVVGNGVPRALVVGRTALAVRPVDGLDPRLGLAEVTAELAPGDGPGTDFDGADRVDWDGAVALGRLALGHQLLGAARAMLEMARRHALDRIQFGRPIASFQAIRHRLADSLVAIEAAAALLDAAWEDPSPIASAMAKAQAGRAARTVAGHSQQVLAGIGFTAEHPFHRHLRRTLVLDQLLGAGRDLTRHLGTEVLRTGALPPTLSL